jgi:hypothetical protein
MNIAQVMAQTCHQYNGTHRFFKQLDYQKELSPGNQAGVCMALSKLWLRLPNADKTNDAKLKGLIPAADLKQTHYIDSKRGGNDSAGFKHAELTEGWAKRTYRGNDMWLDAAEEITDFALHLNRLITLNWPGNGEAHAVAACWVPPIDYLYFDPNGGVLRFADSDDLFTWLYKEMPKATNDRYDDIHVINVYDYSHEA